MGFRKGFWAVIFGVTFVVSCNGFCAEQYDEDSVDLEKIVVTPYKAQITTDLNASSTDVVSVDPLGPEGDYSITDAIENLPSISYATTGGYGGETGVFIRGANSNQTQVLLDGIKIYDPIVTSGYYYGYNYMSMDNIKRVEVLKGPYSALYGSGSIGGTISMLTRKGKGKPQLSYIQELGSYKTLREALSSQGQLDKFAYSFSVSRKDVDAFYSAKYDNENHEMDPFHNLNANVRMDYALTDTLNIGLLTDYTYAKYEYDGTSWTPPYPPVDDDDNYAYYYQGIGGLNLNHNLTDQLSYKLVLGYTRIYRKGWEDSSTDYWYNGKTYQVKGEGNYKIGGWNNTIFGFDLLREVGEGYWSPSSDPKKEADSDGYYLENIFTPTENILLSAAYRLEYHSMFHYNSVFNASGSYMIEKSGTKLKCSVGQGFKAPSLYQLFDVTSGNSSLNPEKSLSYEAGVDQKIGRLLSLGATYFNTHMNDLIDWVSTGGWSGTYKNTSKARMNGIELSASYDFDKNTSVVLGYTHMRAITTDGTRLSRRANDKLNCNFKVGMDKFTFGLDLSYVGNRIDNTNKLDPYVLGNLSVGYAFNKNWDFYTRFENILNYDYELVTGYEMPKFSAYIGAKLKF